MRLYTIDGQHCRSTYKQGAVSTSRTALDTLCNHILYIKVSSMSVDGHLPLGPFVVLDAEALHVVVEGHAAPEVEADQDGDGAEHLELAVVQQ
jgi:hypothetical protein